MNVKGAHVTKNSLKSGLFGLVYTFETETRPPVKINHGFTTIVVSLLVRLSLRFARQNIQITNCLSPCPSGLFDFHIYSSSSSSHVQPSFLRAIMVSHKEFVDAGKKPGLQVWRIENLDLKPVPKALHGSFFTGDAYLLLFTTSAPSYNIHMWLGKT